MHSAEHFGIRCFSIWVNFLEFFGRNCPSLKILPGGPDVVRRPGSPENARGKGAGFDSPRRAPIQHILLNYDDGEDDEHEEDYKDNKDDGHKDDEDDNDENEDEDELSMIKGKDDKR